MEPDTSQSTNQPINPSPTAAPYNPEQVVSEVEPRVKGQSNPVLVILSLFLIILVGVVAFLAYQNYQLQKQISLLTATPTPSPTPIATTDPTANWKIYTNKSGTFSFKYPESWFLGNSPDGDSILLDESSFDPNLVAEPDQVEITFTTTANKELVRAYIDNYISTSQVTTNNNIVFNIKDKSLGPKEEGPASQYLFAQTEVNNNLYRFGLTHATYKPVFDQILSTFEFLGDTTIDDRSQLTKYLTDKYYDQGKLYGKTLDEVVILISKLEGNYATGNGGFKTGGGDTWFATKANGSWLLVEQTQEPPSCKIMTQYNFPKSISGECIEK